MYSTRSTSRFFIKIGNVTNVHNHMNVGSLTLSRNHGTKIEFQEFGDPEKVLRKRKFHISKPLNSTQVLLKIIAAPVHPADINTIQGTYGIKLSLPAVPGIEGVAKVVQVGSEVEDFKENDHVVPVHHKWGTWTTHQVCDDTRELLKIPKDIPWKDAASVVINPVTAYRMLIDFVPLNVGDTVIQNAANSAVGQAVIHIARHMGFKTINIVRSRPDIDELKERLYSIGGNYVLTEEDLRLTDAEKIFRDVPRPKLALNCVGGRSASSILKWMDDDGKMVMFGGMSHQPTTLPVMPLIFRNISVHGFWCGRWIHEERNSQKFKIMMNNIFQMIRDGKLKAPSSNIVPFSDFQTAVSNAMKPYVGKKQLLVM